MTTDETTTSSGAEPLLFNGVNGSTGAYLQPPITLEELVAQATGQSVTKREKDQAERQRAQKEDASFGLTEDVDFKNLSEAGWGVIFAQNADPAIEDELRPLLELRQRQAGPRYRKFSGDKGYHPGTPGNKNDPPDSAATWLARQETIPGVVDPDKVPYYVLIVGDPETIPFSFQFDLDVDYAVGRIHFPALADYACYAQSVVNAENGQVICPKRAVFFGVQNEGDGPTALSATQLVTPLADKVRQKWPDWSIDLVLAEQTTKQHLTELLSANQPAFLFTASHGMYFDPGDPHQIEVQGALLCSDWPGPNNWGLRPIPDTFIFAGRDALQSVRPQGLISFHFACFGAGTPKYNDFIHRHDHDDVEQFAAQSFLARLPQCLLSHPQGGALACVSHVDRAWPTSITWQHLSQVDLFASMAKRLFNGYPVGHAMQFFNDRYVSLAASLLDLLYQIQNFGRVVDDPAGLVAQWTANNDARSYAIVGDPAVRLAVGKDGS